ncbi:hypothetical protein R1flu_021196 [Riccia fluitans]|uniref:Uncharacterized protein n=1 Tax=Riccia fluitans TaxID=41844 RepID=A0ABD1ZNQ0_9MARC
MQEKRRRQGARAFAYERADRAPRNHPDDYRRVRVTMPLAAIGTSRKPLKKSPYCHPAKKEEEEGPGRSVGPGGGSSAQQPAERQRNRRQETIEEDRPDIGPRYTDEEIRRRHPELFV